MTSKMAQNSQNSVKPKPKDSASLLPKTGLARITLDWQALLPPLKPFVGTEAAELDDNDNRLPIRNSSVANLPLLQQRRVAKNKLQNVSRNIEDWTRFKALWFPYNKITFSISGLQQLRSLDYLEANIPVPKILELSVRVRKWDASFYLKFSRDHNVVNSQLPGGIEAKSKLTSPEGPPTEPEGKDISSLLKWLNTRDTSIPIPPLVSALLRKRLGYVPGATTCWQNQAPNTKTKPVVGSVGTKSPPAEEFRFVTSKLVDLNKETTTKPAPRWKAIRRVSSKPIGGNVGMIVKPRRQRKFRRFSIKPAVGYAEKSMPLEMKEFSHAKPLPKLAESPLTSDTAVSIVATKSSRVDVPRYLEPPMKFQPRPITTDSELEIFHSAMTFDQRYVSDTSNTSITDLMPPEQKITDMTISNDTISLNGSDTEIVEPEPASFRGFFSVTMTCAIVVLGIFACFMGILAASAMMVDQGIMAEFLSGSPVVQWLPPSFQKSFMTCHGVIVDFLSSITRYIPIYRTPSPTVFQTVVHVVTTFVRNSFIFITSTIFD